MSSEITTAFVKQYNSNVFHLSQQKGSRLRDKVRRESQKGESQFYDRLGAATAVLRTSRHSDTPQIDSAHSRRRVTLKDYEWADLIDEMDRVRTLIDPTSPYVQSAVFALGRATDDEILDQASAAAYGGVDGATSVALGNGQKIASVAATAGSTLNVEAMRAAVKILNSNDVDESIRRFGAFNARQQDSLLAETEVTSSDFNSVRALVMGTVNSFLGIEWTRTERINVQSGTLNFDTTTGAVGSGSGDADTYQKVLVWAEDGLLLATAKDITTSVDVRPDKSYSTQVYARMSMGATRMEEEKVVEILCTAS